MGTIGKPNYHIAYIIIYLKSRPEAKHRSIARKNWKNIRLHTKSMALEARKERLIYIFSP